MVWSIVFTTAVTARRMVQLPPKPRCILGLMMMLHDNYLRLVESNNPSLLHDRRIKIEEIKLFKSHCGPLYSSFNSQKQNFQISCFRYSS